MSELFEPKAEYISRIQSELLNGKKLIIYGCNDFSEQFLYRTRLKPVYYVEDSPAMKEFMGIKVLDVNDLIYFKPDEVYIAAIKPDEHFPHIMRRLSAYGLAEYDNYLKVSEPIWYSNKMMLRDSHLSVSYRFDEMEGFDIYGDDDPDITIVSLGGSTTAPAFSMGYSWPEALCLILQKLGIKTKVYNGGFQGYMSAEELTKLIRDVTAITPPPDIVISYSGNNDYTFNDYIPNHNRYKRPYLSHPQEILFRWLSNYEKKGTLYGLQTEKSCAEYWVDNERMMGAVCNQFGINFIGVLQANLYSNGYEEADKLIDCSVKNFLKETRLGLIVYDNYINRSDSFYTEAEKLIEKLMSDYNGGNKNYRFYSFRRLFKNFEGIFYDNRHVTTKGNRIIAAYIFEILKESEMLVKRGISI